MAAAKVKMTFKIPKEIATVIEENKVMDTATDYVVSTLQDYARQFMYDKKRQELMELIESHLPDGVSKNRMIERADNVCSVDDVESLIQEVKQYTQANTIRRV